MSESMNANEGSELKKLVKKILSEEKPKSVRKLSERVAELSKKERKHIYNIIREMEFEGEIKLGSPRVERKLPTTVFQYILESHYYSLEFWGLIIMTVFFALTVLLIPIGSSFQFVRIIMGIIYGLFIPGWAITNCFFPILYETIDQVERILLAIGTNIAIMIFGGLVLDQVWAINNPPFVIMLSSITVGANFLTVCVRILISTGKLAAFSQNIKTKVLKAGKRNAEKIDK